MNIYLWLQLTVKAKGKETVTRRPPMSSWETPWPVEFQDYLQKKCDRLNDKPALKTSDTTVWYYLGDKNGEPIMSERI